jgi:predicted adenine nucleotide alpha hydrolase (AANH) superfamily ATPase
MDKEKTLLLHSCCAPCSSYVLEFLRADYHISVFFYNPNITDQQEYLLRLNEQKRLCALFGVDFIEGKYNPEQFYEYAGINDTSVINTATAPEGGERCFKCYELRLRETNRIAAKEKFAYFATTLTISPLKNAEKINEIGLRIADGATYLPSNFKKKGGYQRSLELSKQYSLYRQNYCGCEYSMI